MYPTNKREGYEFMCLERGRSRHSNNWTTKPITTEVMQCVEEIAKDRGNIEELLQLTEEEELNELHRKAINRIQRANTVNKEHNNNVTDEIMQNEDTNKEN